MRSCFLAIDNRRRNVYWHLGSDVLGPRFTFHTVRYPDSLTVALWGRNKPVQLLQTLV